MKKHRWRTPWSWVRVGDALAEWENKGQDLGWRDGKGRDLIVGIVETIDVSIEVLEDAIKVQPKECLFFEVKWLWVRISWLFSPNR